MGSDQLEHGVEHLQEKHPQLGIIVQAPTRLFGHVQPVQRRLAVAACPASSATVAAVCQRASRRYDVPATRR